MSVGIGIGVAVAIAIGCVGLQKPIATAIATATPIPIPMIATQSEHALRPDPRFWIKCPPIYELISKKTCYGRKRISAPLDKSLATYYSRKVFRFLLVEAAIFIDLLMQAVIVVNVSQGSHQRTPHNAVAAERV